jgi:hypothetical protein
MNQALREVDSLHEVQMDSKRAHRRLARVERVYKALKRQLAEATVGIRSQQEWFAQQLGDLKRLFTKSSDAQSASEKKTAD